MGESPVEDHLIGAVARHIALLGCPFKQLFLLFFLGLGLPHRPLEAGDQHHFARPLDHRPRQVAPLEGGLGKPAEGLLPLLVFGLVKALGTRIPALPLLPGRLPFLRRLRRRKAAAALLPQPLGMLFADPIEGLLEAFGHMVQRVPVFKLLGACGPSQLGPDSGVGHRGRRRLLPAFDLDLAHSSSFSARPSHAP